MTSPKLIVLEGIDGCGKTTQLERLLSLLRQEGRKVAVTAEPTESATGKMLREALAGKDPRTPAEMAALFTLDRIHHNVGAGGIREQMEAGFDVVSDRYYYSSLAYQGSLTDYEWVKQMNCNCPDIRRPDLCIFLDIPIKDALGRIAKRHEEIEIYEKEETLSLVRETFLKVFSTLPDRVAVIDASLPPDEVAARVAAVVLPLIRS